MFNSIIVALVASALIWGIWNEEKLAELEDRLFEKIAAGIRRKSDRYKSHTRFAATDPKI